MSAHQLHVRFWGSRGNAAPLLVSREFGIHTTSLEIRSDQGWPVLADLGTGAIGAGSALLDRGQREFDVFISHLHIDHLQGLFGFPPLYRPDCRVRLHAARPDLRAAVETLFNPPFHPVPLARLPAQVEFVEGPPTGRVLLAAAGLTVTWCPLAHPQGSTAYRFDDGENALVFATDVELGAAGTQAPLEQLLRTPFVAGLAIVDGFFTDEELPGVADWGHSSWSQARELAGRTGVRHLVILHHHPRRTDSQLRELEQRAAPVHWARETETLSLKANRLGAGTEGVA